MRSTTKAPRSRCWAVFAVASLGGAIVLGACGSSDASADDALASSQAFVSEVSSFRFEAAIESTYVDSPLDAADDESGSEPEWPREGPGTTTTDRTTMSGSWTSDGWEAAMTDSWGRSEMKVFGSTAYARDDSDGETSEWQSYDVPQVSREEAIDELRSMAEAEEEMAAEMEEAGDEYVAPAGDAAGFAASLYLGGSSLGGPDLFEDPAGFLQAIEEMHDPTLLGRDGENVVVSTEVTAPADVEDAWGAPLPAGRLELTTGDDGTPVALRLRVDDEESSADVEIRFSSWNEPLEVIAPSDDEIDHTPWIDEEGLAAITGVTLLRPTALPDGMTLDYVGVLTADDSPEGCDQVEMGWSSAMDDASAFVDGGTKFMAPGDFLSIYLLPQACAQEADGTPFAVGPFAPLSSRSIDDGVEVLVGDTVVQITTTLSPDELAAAVASIAPTDVAALAAELASTNLLTS